eukprot:TRINITY_DN79526_c0_g1_i1.p1 TRINITY_DN79526_c0_g1~~TRINITY_DN79526_c0_g1_i1.p1  ORF type:complete len:446 (+),score=50.83 TRINITY_DN79526_c0_g1_i1:61-1338(+)
MEVPKKGNGRKLDGVEMSYTASHRVMGGANVVHLVFIEPAVSHSDVAEAAEKLQGHHPLLRAGMRTLGKELILDDTAGRPVEVRDYDGDLEEAASKESLDLLDIETSSWRLALANGGRCLLFTYCHGFFDGGAAMVVLEDFLTALDGNAPPQELGAGDGATLLPPACHIWKKPSAELPPLPAVEVALEAETWVPMLKRHVRFQMRSLSVDQSARLRQVSKSEGTSIHGALGAAFCHAVGAIAELTAGLKISTAVDLRSNCGLPPRTMGNINGCFSSVLALDLPFWELARKYKAHVQEVREQGLPEPMFYQLGDDVPYFAFEDGFAKQMADIDEQRGTNFQDHMGISNRGAYTLSSEAHKVTGVYWTNKHWSKWVYMLLNIVSVNGTLCLTLNYTSPIVGDETGIRIADRIVEELLKATEGWLPHL